MRRDTTRPIGGPAATFALLLVALVGCDTEGSGDAGVDASSIFDAAKPAGDASATEDGGIGLDAASEAGAPDAADGSDAGRSIDGGSDGSASGDASVDAGVDAGVDGGPGCFSGRAVPPDGGSIPDGATLDAGASSDSGPMADGATASDAGPPRSPIVDLASGRLHSCARLRDGQVWCWGQDDRGQTGQFPFEAERCAAYFGTVACTTEPTAVASLADIVEISALEDFSCAIDAAGLLWCWGYNGWGGLGVGSNDSDPHPSAFSVCLPGAARHVAVGSYHACAVVEVDAGADAGVDGTDRVYCWGLNDRGQAGVAPSSSATCTRRASTGRCVLRPVEVPGLTSVRQLALGLSHSCALTEEGAVLCWGGNSAGQLGRGSYDGLSHPSPEAVPGLANVSELSGGRSFTCARAEGVARCWGIDDVGQLGVGDSPAQICTVEGEDVPCSTSPVEVFGLTEVSAVDAGGYHACAVHAEGSLSCWGDHTEGQLGVPGAGASCGFPLTCSRQPVSVEGIGATAYVRAGGHHTLAMASDEAWAWGWNVVRQLGTGSTAQSVASPAPILGL